MFLMIASIPFCESSQFPKVQLLFEFAPFETELQVQTNFLATSDLSIPVDKRCRFNVYKTSIRHRDLV